jgi:hypothetical protein
VPEGRAGSPDRPARSCATLQRVIHEVDQALRALIGTAPRQRGVELVFDAPTKDWAARRSAPTINVFLYDIREDTSRRDVAPQPMRDDDGRIVGRQAPPRRIRLSYLVTAWGQRAEDEHRLLANLLGLFLQYDQIPEEHLPDDLAAVGIPVLLSLGSGNDRSDRSSVDLWSAMGGELRASIEVAVVAPLDPVRAFETGPPVLEPPRVEITTTPARKRARGRGKAASGSPSRLGADASPGAEEVIGGSDEQPGRTIRVRPLAK